MITVPVGFCLVRGLLYKSSLDCLLQTIRGEGFMSLYKGFLPTWMRMVNSRLFCSALRCSLTVRRRIDYTVTVPFLGPVVHDVLADL